MFYPKLEVHMYNKNHFLGYLALTKGSELGTLSVLGFGVRGISAKFR